MISEGAKPEAESAAGPAPAYLESWVHSSSRDDLLRAAADPSLNDDLALALLQRGDLPAELLEHLAKNANALKFRKVKLALASHPHAPRHVSVPLIRQFYTFDLMKVALMPSVPADVKVAADETLIARIKTVTLGERLGLARRGSGRVAGALLLDGDPRVMQTALENGRLTEASVIEAALRPQASPALVQGISLHSKWCYRREVRLALLRTEHLSLAKALEFTQGIHAALVRDILRSSKLPARIKELILRESAEAQQSGR